MGEKTGNLSVLCADISGVASLTYHVDMQEAAHAARRFETRIRLSVESHGGRLLSSPGNRLIAYFPDHVDALQSAIDMQRRVSSLPPCAGISLFVRVGLCTGHQLKEARYFPGDGPNPAVSLSADAAPGHILLSIPRRIKGFPWAQLAADRIANVSLQCGKRGLGVFDIPWQDRDPVSLRLALAQLASAEHELSIRYRGLSLRVDSNRPRLTIGRTSGCDLAIRDPRCSRVHGVIEKRLDRFVFVDRSSNGTYLTPEGRAEIHIHNREIELAGRGHLSLGSSAGETGLEVLQFQVGHSLR
ncbi:MAG: FHA domain-containing protein [Dechloromonas sp.]|nr:FHA domain-containing protein [Dechloromonas sp.]